MKNKKTLTVTLSALAFLLLSAGGVAYAAGGEGSHKFGDLSDDQRAVFEEARGLKQGGDFEGARDLIESSGMELPIYHHEKGFSEEMMEKHEGVREAIESGDYDTFLDLTEDSSRQVEINEETFNKLVEAHSLREVGDHEAAHEIMQELKGLGIHKGSVFAGHNK